MVRKIEKTYSTNAPKIYRAPDSAWPACIFSVEYGARHRFSSIYIQSLNKELNVILLLCSTSYLANMELI